MTYSSGSLCCFSSLLLAVGLGAACSSGIESTATTTTGADPPTHAEPPDAGPAKAADGTGTTTFAISRLFLGNVDLDGTPDPVNGWKSFGFDLDGKISTLGNFAELCQPAGGSAAKAVHLDGKNGIDNAFGKSILPILRGISPNFADTVNKDLAAGGPTLLFDLEKLGGGSEYNPLSGRLYVGTALGSAPAYDGKDAWPVRSDLLVDPADVTTPRVRFPGGYLASGTWVGRADGDVPLVLHGLFTSAPIHLVIHHALVSMTLDAAHENVVRGTLAGIVSPADVVAEINRVGVQLGSTFCDGPTPASIDLQLVGAADILANGSQDPALTCDGISIGLGFEARRVQLGAPTAPDPLDLPSPDPCP
jgi:hypothetical protein